MIIELVEPPEWFWEMVAEAIRDNPPTDPELQAWLDGGPEPADWASDDK